jgi:ribosomal protein S18 acetylase RimI-like enzyme
MNQHLKEAIRTLLSKFPFKPLRYYREIEESAIIEYLLCKIESLEESPKNSIITIRENGEVRGLGVIEHLDFDTSLLQKESARIAFLIASGECYEEKASIVQKLLKEVDSKCVRGKVNFLSCKIDLSDTPSLHQLEECGFRLMGVEITLSLEEGKNFQSLSNYRIRECKKEDIDELKEITRTSFFLDRFHTDPEIPRSLSNSLYEKWIENCCMGLVDGAVLVAEDALGVPKGYIVVKLERVSSFGIGSIVLIAVSPTSTGRGIGQALTREGVRWLKERGAHVVEVETQARNYRALWVFQKAGFRVTLGRAIFHKWLK